LKIAAIVAATSALHRRRLQRIKIPRLPRTDSFELQYPYEAACFFGAAVAFLRARLRIAREAVTFRVCR
jgi:hypothetical protein